VKLYAISDLHVNHTPNGDALEALPAHPEDWLIVGGDVGESEVVVIRALHLLTDRFAQVLWVPGNHELWAVSKDGGLRGVARYDRFVSRCRDLGVLTPEDPYPLWPGAGPPTRIAPLFTLYDYSFAPEGIGSEDVGAWARESGIVPVDDRLLLPDPYPSRVDWCHARVAWTERRLSAVPAGERLVLVNHWPLREDLVRLYRVPRYTPWCGTRLTEDWHRRFPVDVVIYGHLHMRATDWRDGVRFEEVALGYGRHWDHDRGVEGYLRQILPRPSMAPPGGWGGPVWDR